MKRALEYAVLITEPEKGFLDKFKYKLYSIMICACIHGVDSTDFRSMVVKTEERKKIFV